MDKNAHCNNIKHENRRSGAKYLNVPNVGSGGMKGGSSGGGGRKGEVLMGGGGGG